MWARRRIDIGWADLGFGLFRCIWPGKPCRAWIEAQWAGDAPALACLSVRTGFDLLLEALQLPAGTEVLMSAVNVPAMFRLVEEHGLTPVPLDVDGDHLRPSAQAVRAAITPRTRMVVVAHLFGTKADLADIATLARAHRLLLVEYHAQAFAGMAAELPATADAALWSFGPIKAATALGGGVVAMRDAALAARMRVIETGRSPQSRWRYMLRIAKYAVLKALSYRVPFGMVVRSLEWVRRDYDAWLKARVRSFNEATLLADVRQRPCTPMLALLARRLRHYRSTPAHRRRGRWLVDAFGGVPVVGAGAAWQGFDLLALRVPDPAHAVTTLRRAGFDAGVRGNLAVCPVRDGMCNPVRAERLLEEAVFVPFYAAMPDRELRRLSEVVVSLKRGGDYDAASRTAP